jgi:hypothetical protein
MQTKCLEFEYAYKKGINITALFERIPINQDKTHAFPDDLFEEFPSPTTKLKQKLITTHVIKKFHYIDKISDNKCLIQKIIFQNRHNKEFGNAKNFNEY